MNDASVVEVPEGGGGRLDIFLSQTMGKSRTAIQKMIKDGRMYIDEKKIMRGSFPVVSGMTIHVRSSFDTPGQSTKKHGTHFSDQLISSKEPIRILAETDAYMVVSKPAGMLVHATDAEETGTLAEWLLKMYPALESVGDHPKRPGIVHRLDKDASGVLIIAKTQPMYEHLKKQFQRRTVEKQYVVLAHGVIPADHDTISFPIDRGKEGRMVSRPELDPLKLKHVRYRQPGKDANTEFWVTRRFQHYTLLEVRIHSGRTHQIRVHLFAYNHPVVGDALYGQKKNVRKRAVPLNRLFLHAQTLCFLDFDGKKQCVTDPLPSSLIEYLAYLE
ncbi:MAG TPA: hypothetical protein DCY48_01020 [Candidatus Magasanikbacteria bacterium]|nr:MAG: hypothetical protein A3I74_01890 [Candidatus Magasanikbacteria bacterium RIFCSPLOWO2_02_FULL_47_16]OGH79825.1 MAG: hypothetical protein A3C10_05200 [Candidatus Magasanikbacteria bacterium RIFCSPHIGHO2_02_FULL_48_18]OGH83047.1 MAG: hypothetical protein A3G08_01375 [Candidatus Magasanikbacteria bacterium RIFCSPLOWO2_12_FULL_47_9b]HAZ28340.1 hypothetical protein [Candidatus Magasanikbacteria bacterium]